MIRCMWMTIPLLILGLETPVVRAQPVAGTTLEIPMVQITLPDDKVLWVSQTEITWDLYDALVYRLDEKKTEIASEDAITRPTKPYVMADRGWGHAGFPALSISHRGAQAFCEWMKQKTGQVWRLPTESEWTHFCKSARITSSQLDDMAWHAGNAERRTHHVGSKKMDANGLYDLAGNVSEWCQTDDGDWVLMGPCFLDVIETDLCDQRRVPIPAWNETDPQIPKSQWWLSDAPFAGFRVVCESPPPPIKTTEDHSDE